MRGFYVQHTSIFIFCFAFFAKHPQLKSQTPEPWIQYKEQPYALSNILRYGTCNSLEASFTFQKLVVGTDLNRAEFNLLYHNSHTYGLNLSQYGSPDYQTLKASMGYLWHQPKVDAVSYLRYQKTTLESSVFTPGLGVSIRSSKSSKVSAYYQHREAMGLGYHIQLLNGGLFNIHYSVPAIKTGESTQHISCSFYYPASASTWMGIESQPQLRFNQLTCIHQFSKKMNAAIHFGYFSTFQTLKLSFYVGLSLD